MSMAATNSQIQAAISDAESLNVTPTQMVALLDKAIAAAHLDGLATASYTIAGRTRQVALTEAKELRKYYAGISGGGGGTIFIGAEFG